MSLAENWWVLALVGMLSGLLGGTLGVGGGTIIVPALVLLSYPQKDAQGLALAVMVPVTLLGAIRYRMNPEIQVDLRVVGFMVLGGLAGVLLGTAIAAAVPAAFLRKLFGVLLVVVALRMFMIK